MIRTISTWGLEQGGIYKLDSMTKTEGQSCDEGVGEAGTYWAGVPWWWLRRKESGTQVRSLGWEDLLEEGMATHSSILAWRIPCTEEPGRLQSMGLPRVGHDCATNTFTFFSQTWTWPHSRRWEASKQETLPLYSHLLLLMSLPELCFLLNELKKCNARESFRSPAPAPLSVEKLSSRKLVSGSKVAGDCWCRQSKRAAILSGLILKPPSAWKQCCLRGLHAPPTAWLQPQERPSWRLPC